MFKNKGKDQDVSRENVEISEVQPLIDMNLLAGDAETTYGSHRRASQEQTRGNNFETQKHLSAVWHIRR